MKNFHAGTNINQGYYKSFQPELINRPWQLDDMKMVQLLTEANRQIGKLDMYSEYIPNIELFISMHVIKEATQSSKIEGTQTRIEEALLNKEDIAPNKRDDWQEVQNYIKAMNYAIDRMKTLPLSTRLIRETHQILLDGVRGKNKLPGEFRKSQNWIGGANINDAVFIPPVHNSVDDLMSDIEKFLHNEESYFPDLLKIALIHYQFETIHPFLDGNGRIGRLLITLYLVDKQILKSPILYLSDFFERNRVLYYDNLMRVRTHNDIKQWCYFFLSGIIEISKNGINTFDNILKLKQKLETIFRKMGSKAPYGRKLVNYLYKNPLVAASKVTEITGLSKSSAYKLVNDLEGLKILREITGSKRGKIYLFAEYLGFFQS